MCRSMRRPRHGRCPPRSCAQPGSIAARGQPTCEFSHVDRARLTLVVHPPDIHACCRFQTPNQGWVLSCLCLARSSAPLVLRPSPHSPSASQRRRPTSPTPPAPRRWPTACTSRPARSSRPTAPRGCRTTTPGSAASRRPRTPTSATSSTPSVRATAVRARASAAFCPTRARAPTPPASPPSSTRRPSSPGPVTSSRSSPTAPRPARRSSGRAGTATRTASRSRTRSRPSGSRTRPTAVSIGPDGNAYVAFQREDDVQQITDVDSPSPTVRIVATTTDGRAALSAAAGRDAQGHVALYLAEQTGALSVVTPGAGTQVARPLGVTVPGAISALAYDLARPALRRHRERRDPGRRRHRRRAPHRRDAADPGRRGRLRPRPLHGRRLRCRARGRAARRRRPRPPRPGRAARDRPHVPRRASGGDVTGPADERPHPDVHRHRRRHAAVPPAWSRPERRMGCVPGRRQRHARGRSRRRDVHALGPRGSGWGHRHR